MKRRLLNINKLLTLTRIADACYGGGSVYYLHGVGDQQQTIKDFEKAAHLYKQQADQEGSQNFLDKLK